MNNIYKIFQKIKNKDYCTGFFEIWNGMNLSCYCKRHDKCYESSGISRKDCDREFRKDIANVSATLSWCMYIAVRVLGGSRYKK